MHMLLELTFYLAENATPLWHRKCRERLVQDWEPQPILTKHTSDKSYKTIFSNFQESWCVYFFLICFWYSDKSLEQLPLCLKLLIIPQHCFPQGNVHKFLFEQASVKFYSTDQTVLTHHWGILVCLRHLELSSLVSQTGAFASQQTEHIPLSRAKSGEKNYKYKICWFPPVTA